MSYKTKISRKDAKTQSFLDLFAPLRLYVKQDFISGVHNR